MDFAKCYKIKINWDHTGVSYLWYKGRKVMSDWYSSAMPQCVSGITNHVTDMDTTSNGLGPRLETIMIVTIPPHHMAIIPVAPPSHSLDSSDITTGLIGVMER